ncbi:MAG: ABC transporter ATP-binding protein [Candidatus Thorarchaeota archaeon]
MNNMLIECSDLIKIYPGVIDGLNVPALRGIDLRIKKGALISIIGPSGSGKSTLIRLLGGLDKPSSGEIWVDGNLLNKYGENQLAEYRQKVGFLYQTPEKNLLPHLTILQNVMLPMMMLNAFPREEKHRAFNLLAEVSLIGKEQRKPNQLSGGEIQRAGLAVALANDPIILLADEPTGELDTESTFKIISYLKSLNAKLGITTIVATHDIRLAKKTEINYRLKNGRIIYQEES